ncbi:MAG: hypothetical protein F6K30_01400 [Cyanothece sp. SIO2G6]|nr:hypothetical protein [Cyanothece sp. SIO2G6]
MAICGFHPFRWRVALWVVVSRAMILAISIAVVSCSRTPTENRIQDIVICAYNESHECDRPIAEFSQPPSLLMATAEIAEVPVDQQIIVEWRYLADESDMPLVISTLNYAKTSSEIISMFAVLGQPDNGWPVGVYEIVLSVDDSPDKMTRQSFVIGPTE